MASGASGQPLQIEVLAALAAQPADGVAKLGPPVAVAASAEENVAAVAAGALDSPVANDDNDEEELLELDESEKAFIEDSYLRSRQRALSGQKQEKLHKRPGTVAAQRWVNKRVKKLDLQP